MKPEYALLRKEFDGADDSFILQLRTDFVWDRESFSRLIAAMKIVCEDHEGAESVEKWIASGFWYLAVFVKDHTLHPEFRKPYSTEYYDKAFLLIEDLGTRLFMGSCPVLDRARETYFTI